MILLESARGLVGLVEGGGQERCETLGVSGDLEMVVHAVDGERRAEKATTVDEEVG
jgi:hypothetical protein